MLRVDLHVHSGATRHAMAHSPFELAFFASLKGIEAIAITDHGPALEGDAPPMDYFKVLAKSRAKSLWSFFDFQGGPAPYWVHAILNSCRKLPDVRIFSGCEANILNEDGRIDLPEAVQNSLDVVMAGFHPRTEWSSNLGQSANTRAMIKAIEKNRICVVSHPYKFEFPIDVTEVCRAAADNNTALEVNLAVLAKCRAKDDIVATNTLKMIEGAQKIGTKLTISTDAHDLCQLGDDRILGQFDWDIPEKAILGQMGGVKEVEKFLWLE